MCFDYRNALEVLSHAYNNKRLTIPSEVLVHWLHFADEFEAQAVCAHYGLKVEKHAVRFDKTDFAGDSTLVSFNCFNCDVKFLLSRNM